MVALREKFRPFVMTNPEGVRRSFKAFYDEDFH